MEEKVGLLATDPECLKRGKIDRKKKGKEAVSRRVAAY